MRTSQTSGGPLQTIFFRALAPKGSGPKGKRIAVGIAIVSHTAASLLPDMAKTFPEVELEKEKLESWMHKQIVKPVKKMVWKTFR